MRNKLGFVLLGLLVVAGCQAKPGANAELEHQQSLQYKTDQSNITNCSEQAAKSGLEPGANTLYLNHFNKLLNECFILAVIPGLDGQSTDVWMVPDTPYTSTDAKLIIDCFQSFPYVIAQARQSYTCTDSGQRFPVIDLPSHISTYMDN